MEFLIIIIIIIIIKYDYHYYHYSTVVGIIKNKIEYIHTYIYVHTLLGYILWWKNIYIYLEWSLSQSELD